MGDALINQAGFFTPGDDLNRRGQQTVGLPDKLLSVIGLAQCIGGNDTDVLSRNRSQSNHVALQTLKSAVHRLDTQVAIDI